MPSSKRPAPEDAVTARRALLDGLASDADIFDVLSGLAPLHPRNNTFPGEVFLHLAADALEWCGVSQANPLPLEGLRERFLPDAAFRGRQNAKFQYAVLAAAGIHGGCDPDLLDEVASWQTDDFWQYAAYAAVAYIRAVASQAGVPVRQACQDLARGERLDPLTSCRIFLAARRPPLVRDSRKPGRKRPRMVPPARPVLTAGQRTTNRRQHAPTTREPAQNDPI